MEEEHQKALDKKREIYEELHRNDMTIIQLQNQVQEGVEVKDKSKEYCSECGQEVKEDG